VFQFREKVYEIYEEICGARLTTNMGRIGFERDWSPKLLKITFLEEFPAAWKEFENLFERNRIFIDRTVNVGAITLTSYGLWFYRSKLRAAGVDYDVRVAQPSSYEDFDFIIPVGKSGDTYDRFVFVMPKYGRV
jgi:NADH-quinone oxidoreductase subunit D